MNHNRKATLRVIAVAMQLLIMAIALVYIGAKCIGSFGEPVLGGICLWASGALSCAFALLE